MRRRTFLLGVSGVALAGAVPGALVLRSGAHDAASAPSDGSTARKTAKVTRRDLAETTTAAGTLGYGEPRPLALGAPGTITALPAIGTIVDRGGQLAEVDGLPVVLLLGDRPMWRALGEGVTDGPDVEQLEANLIELGHGTEAALGPNDRWSAATTAAVQRWQAAVGVDESGTVAIGQMVFQPSAVRVAAHAAEVGAMAGGPVLQVTGTVQSVHVDLSARKQALVHAGDTVQVVLPSGTTTPATIASIGSVATAAQPGADATIPLTVSFTDPTAAPAGLDQAPVTIKITTTAATGVLAVPVEALLALAEGGYAVEQVTGATTTLVGVTLGASADGWAEVRGNVAEGDAVVTAK